MENPEGGAQPIAKEGFGVTNGISKNCSLLAAGDAVEQD